MPLPGAYEATKVDRELFGVFKEEETLAAGDPYFDIKDTPERFKGKQFGNLGNTGSTGQGALIDKTMKLTVGGDTFTDGYKIQRFMEKRGTGEPVSTKPFAPSNPASKTTGPGSLFGTFGPQNTLVDNDASASLRRGPPPNPADKKKNLYVNPAKKGSYGFPVSDRSIGATKFGYVPDTYAYGRTLEKKMKAEARAKITKPFVGMGRVGRGITPAPYMNSAGPVYKPCPDIRPGRAKEDKPTIQWKPSNPQAKGHGDFGCINRLEYVPQLSGNEKKKAPEKVFKPVGGLHTRLSMWAPNPHTCDARPPPDNDFTLLD
eukprot:gene23158-30365_t